MSPFHILFFLLVGSLLSSLIFSLYRKGYWSAYFQNKYSVPATIISKKLDCTETNISHYILVFGLYTGKHECFHVDQFSYTKYSIGDRGILTYRGTKFIHFRKKY